ncbi:MAG: alpha/beta hydrolase [Clostridia bacterium]|nr:alpha/beta hydrolase [Clostridia bacterium]
MQTRFGEDARIILCGISMGASTVLMAAGKPLPSTVVGVLADCGYHSQKEIIKKVIRQLKLPADLLYPFVKLGARLYGGFDLEELTPMESLQNCRVPVIFFHGEKDGFVPCEMSRISYDACPTKKRLVIVPDADHGLSYPVAPDVYLNALREFFGEELCLKK